MVGERKQTVLVGLSGGVDSMVAAYLLRIQKREVFAVTLAFTPEEMLAHGAQLFACHQSDARLETIKKFCAHLQVPLTVLRPRDEFAHEVLEPWLASRIGARRPRHCGDCQQFRLHWLHRQMKELGCGSFATGHYAKLFKQPDGLVAVHSSNDIQRDQSGILAGLPQEILRDLELPLSELQEKEVQKIAGNFQLAPQLPPLVPGQCLPGSDPFLQQWMEARIPEVWRTKGDIMNVDRGERAGEHHGLHTIEVGARWKRTDRPERPDKEEWVVGAAWPEREIHVADPKWFMDSGVFLESCRWGVGVDFTGPVHGFLHHGGGLNDLEVVVYPKTLGGAVVQLLEGQDRFVPGEDLVVFRRRGKNAKVLLTGRIGPTARHWAPTFISKGENARKENEGWDRDANF